MHFDQSPYFNMTIAACRAAGRIGGRRSALSRRLRGTARPQPMLRPEPPEETARAASALLDEQFPWLRGAFSSRISGHSINLVSVPAESL